MTTKPDLESLRYEYEYALAEQRKPNKAVFSADKINLRDPYGVFVCPPEPLVVAALEALPWLLEVAERAEQPKWCAECGVELSWGEDQ